jgi:hypothetical protein
MELNWKSAKFYGNKMAKVANLTLTVNFLAPSGWFGYVGTELVPGTPCETQEQCETTVEEYVKLTYPALWQFAVLSKPMIFIPDGPHERFNSFPDLPDSGRGRL